MCWALTRQLCLAAAAATHRVTTAPDRLLPLSTKIRLLTLMILLLLLLMLAKMVLSSSARGCCGLGGGLPLRPQSRAVGREVHRSKYTVDRLRCSFLPRVTPH